MSEFSTVNMSELGEVLTGVKSTPNTRGGPMGSPWS